MSELGADNHANAKAPGRPADALWDRMRGDPGNRDALKPEDSATPVPEAVGVMTPEEYLEWERKAELGHEYIQAEIYAHAGASDTHVNISLNVAAALRSQLRGGPCRVYMLDMKVRMTDDAFFYPDVFVTCDERDRRAAHFKKHPVLVLEVLSESTGAFDRGRQFGLYRSLESLREYPLVETERVGVEVFRSGADGHWVLYPCGPGEQVELESVGFRCPVGELYEDAQVGETG